MKFINVSNENMAIVKEHVSSYDYKEVEPGVFTDPWAASVKVGDDSFQILWCECCWDCSPEPYRIVEDFSFASEEIEELFWDWFREVDNYTEPSPYDLTWDFALNVGTDYTNG
jgi:hypothetical protein